MQRVAIWNGLRWLIASIDGLGTESVCDDERRIQRQRRTHHNDEGQERIGPTGKEESAHGFIWGDRERYSLNHFVLFFTNYVEYRIL